MHANESIGNFTADIMAKSIGEIKWVEAEAKITGRCLYQATHLP